jgi:hypothetical protein
MNLALKYLKFINDGNALWTELLIILPTCIATYLLFPEIEYTLKLIISGILCISIVIIHFSIGIYSLIKRDYASFLNFVVLPIFIGVFMLVFGYR